MFNADLKTQVKTCFRPLKSRPKHVPRNIISYTPCNSFLVSDETNKDLDGPFSNEN